MQDYRPNSNRFREERKKAALEDKKIEKVVKGSVTTKKKGEMSKIKEAIISEDADNVLSYIWSEGLVPTIKKAIVDIGTDALNIIFLGGTGRSKSSTSSVNYVSYSRFSDSKDRRGPEPVARTRFDYDTFVYTHRSDAEAVLEQMNDVIDMYGYVTVADLYDMIEKSHPYTSNDYGWTNLRNADVVRVRDGYVLKLPKAMPLDK